ncbi:hypothetical protein MMC25_003471 [Agyrium rufum]|nr:hypothetical protein [Agyrium rufum]
MSTSVATLGRGKEKQLSSAKLEKMVVSIKEQKRIEPLPESIANAVPSTIPSLESDQPTPPPSTTIRSARSSSDSSSDSSNLSGSPESGHNPAENAGSDTSAELLTSHSVVRGFSPGNTSSFRSYTHLAPTPILKSSLQKSSMASKAETKKGGVFFLGASSGEDESSFEEKMASLQPSANRSSRLGPSKKQTSFKAEVESRQAQQRSHENENVFESDEDEEDEEEDESDWEDSASEGDSALDEKPLFQRIPSRPELTSRRSLLTTMIQEPDRAKAFAEMASKSTPALQRSRTSSRNGPSLAASPEEGSIMHEQFQGKGSRPIIMTTSNLHPPSLSPRTTRRNMMSHELTESLRKGLLWERLQKNTTVHAVLRRRHTSQDIAKLKQYPKPIAEDSGSTSKNNSWNNFQDNGLGEYHERGW